MTGERPPKTAAGAGFQTGRGRVGSRSTAEMASSPWFRLIVQIGDVISRATVEYAHKRGLRLMHLPLTTRTVTCPSGLGSDARPVPVVVEGIETYLSDSTQFLLEYGCRLAPGGTYCILPSFRADIPDATHLTQFTHSEAEIPGSLEDVVEYVNGYVRHLAAAALEECGDILKDVVGDLSHLERMTRATSIPCVRFDDAIAFLHGLGLIDKSLDTPIVGPVAERHLHAHYGDFFWLTHFYHLDVPFYQAFDNENAPHALNGDLYFGVGEVVGAGQRHTDGDEIRKALAYHQIPEEDYQWYIEMKDELPMLTSGFGMGVERFLAWMMNHNDVRDIPIVSREGESKRWPARVERP